MIEASIWSGLGPALGGLATFVVVLVVPAIILFHRKVIRPLRFVLGIKEDESPTGEAIPSIPRQLALLRTDQVKLIGNVGSIMAEVFPNHGSSLRDAVDGHGLELQEIRLTVVDLEAAIRKADKDRHRVAQLAVETAAKAKVVADAAAASVAKLAVQTAEDVRAKKELDATNIANTAVSTASDVAQLALDTATALAEDQS